MRLGDNDVLANDDNDNVQDFAIFDRKDGPFNRETFNGDISILILDKDAIFTGSILYIYFMISCEL